VKLTPAEAEKFAKLAAGLLAKNAAQRAELDRMKAEAIATQATLAAVHEHAVAADAQAQKLSGQLTVQTKTLTAAAGTAAKLTQQNKAWADNEEGLWDRIKALGGLAAALLLIALLLGFKFLGVKQTLTDTVAAGEYLKTQAIAAGHNAEELEAKLHTWWEGSKGEAVWADIRSKVLRQ
jgi:hypothetical protein